MAKRRERNVYVAMMVAEARGTGLNLSFEELQLLAMDDAISTYASNSLTAEEWERVAAEGWAGIDPYVERVGANIATGGVSMPGDP